MEANNPEKSAEGIYVLKHESTYLHWLAWREWSAAELGVTYWRHVMNAIMPWPPETWEQAAIVAKNENAIRARVKFGQAAPERPKPWRRWPPDEMDRLFLAESARRDVWGYTPPAPGIGIPAARTGFYRASKSEHAAAAVLKAEMDQWMIDRIGYDPKIGNPHLDNSTARVRTSGELESMLRDARARAPRAFRRQGDDTETPKVPLVMTPELAQRERDIAGERADALARRMQSGGAG